MEREILSENYFYKGNSKYYTCKCTKCNKISNVAAWGLLNTINSCQCNKTLKRAYNYTGFEFLSGKYFNKVKTNALKRNLEFNITIDYIWEIFCVQKEKCKLTNLPIKLMPNFNKKEGQTASLDRIDSSKGYIPGNVQWVHKDVNLMKNKFNEDYFINICKLIYKNNNG